MANFWDQITSRFTPRHLVLLTVTLSALGNVGCSTPPVLYSDPNEPDTSWEAYQDCLNSLPANANTAVCNNVGSTNVDSQSNYTYSGAYVDSNGNVQSTTASASGGSSGPTFRVQSNDAQLKEQLGLAYKAYLSTRDPKDLAQVTSQWRAIASENRAQAASFRSK